MKPLAQMSLLLTKMAVQCVDFSAYSPSILALAAIYASTAFLKHSRTFYCSATSSFCTEVRSIIFKTLDESRHR